MSARAANLLFAAVKKLKPELGRDAARDARLLLAHALGIELGRLTLVLPDAVSADKVAIYDALIAQRCTRKPVSQIIGQREFWGRSFLVTGDVLDPRPETESLIAIALQGAPPKHILDLGLGTGCILLTLLAEMPNTLGLGVDVSRMAVAVAAQNAQALGVSERADLKVSDWFAEVTGQFDLIVSNPPYITAGEMLELAPEVAEWEPAVALTPGQDGLGAYQKIAQRLADFLTPDGRALFEIGYAQGQTVCRIFSKAGFSDVQLLPDMNGHDRVVQVYR